MIHDRHERPADAMSRGQPSGVRRRSRRLGYQVCSLNRAAAMDFRPSSRACHYLSACFAPWARVQTCAARSAIAHNGLPCLSASISSARPVSASPRYGLGPRACPSSWTRRTFSSSRSSSPQKSWRSYRPRTGRRQRSCRSERSLQSESRSNRLGPSCRRLTQVIAIH